MTARSQRLCVLKCRQNKLMHAFPKDEISRNVWLKQLGIKRASATSYVCDRHFSSKMKPQGVGVRLTPWAIPDINLPGTQIETDLENEAQLPSKCRNVSDVYMNGYSKNDVKIENNTSFDDSLDFDVLLAKVHRISDFTNNINNNNNNNNNNDAASIDEDEYEEILGNDYDMDSMQYLSDSYRPSNGIIVEDNLPYKATLSALPTPNVEINSKFKRKLIASVRRRRILYDPSHPSFSNIEKKTKSWERIGKIKGLDATTCRELWMNIRYDYQTHVRNLRQWLAGESYQRDRPRVAFENDLLFLWRYISDNSNCEDSDEETHEVHTFTSTCPPDIADVSSSDKDASVVVNDYALAVDHAYANNKTDESIQFACNLIEAIRPYSELYDHKNPNYGDPKRKSIIWDAISNELNEKATKCLSTWLQLQLRYEFEIIHNKSPYLINSLNFLERHILTNETSLFKRATSLSDQWYEPINTSKDQHIMLQTLIGMKKYRSIFMNIDKPFAINKEVRTQCWIAVAKSLKRKSEQCEVTWIIMQAMYCELLELRNNNCPLRDEWEFESVITKVLASLTQIKEKLSKESKRTKSKNVVLDELELSSNVEPPTNSINEITFTIPNQVDGDNSTNEPRRVRFCLDVPVKDLPEKSVVEIDSVLENAHIVILTRYKRGPSIYLFTLEKRKELIAEVMARPILFNQPCKYSRLSRIFWGEISIEMSYPAEISMFFWEYCMEKSFFVDYDPSFKKSKEPKWIPPPNPIFDKFQKYADSKDWGEYITILPDFIQEISNFPLIYVDLKINSSWNRRQCHARDIAEVWTILARKFAVLENHKVIWDKFKQVFLQYMSEIEISVYNAWPIFWFSVLKKMRFLCELRYDPKDPIYYVIRNKIQDEINENERGEPPAPTKLDPVTNAKAIFGLLKENEYLDDFTWVNRARFVAKMKCFPMLYDISHPLFGNKEAKLDAWQEMALSFHCTVGECHLIFQHLMKNFLIFRARDPNQMCRVNAKYWENMTYIYSCAIPNAIDPKLLEGRSFRATSTGSTIKLAEEYQAEISLVDAKPRLILKNFAAAVNSLPIQIQTSVVQQIKYIFFDHARNQNEEIVVDV